MKKRFIIGHCYKDLFGTKYFCVDITLEGNPILIPYSRNGIEFPCDCISEFKTISYEEN